ncbi:MAG: MBL fold metallo-hydrolase RNA specificity domain-containing protein [Candidatus Micrarchaeia archaeon]
MKLTFLGGAGEVGRSCILAEEKRTAVMLDCGIKLGEREEYPLLDDGLIKRTRRVVVSHAHIDHAGYLPMLMRRGCKASIYATKPTRDLMHLLLADYRRINPEAVSDKEIEEVMRRCAIVEYGAKFGGGIKTEFRRSGHILGGAMIKLSADKNILYTSDIEIKGSRLIEGAETGIRADTLIIESTYGGFEDKHPPAKSEFAKLCETINRTISRGGVVLIPSFAVGRGQEVLITLESYMRSGVIKKVPIWVDGMIIKANRIYRQNVIYARREIQLRILMSDDDPFKSRFFRMPKTKDRSDVLGEGGIIVASSGMLTGGPVVGYLKALAADPKNTLALVGYQAKGTLGRKLLDGERRVIIGGDEINVNMEVVKFELSAHADRQGLVSFARSIRGLKKIFIVHGDERKPYELKESLEKYGYDVVVPANLESYTV